MTNDLIQSAIDKKYSDFDQKTREILQQKVAQKLADTGYFDRLKQAQGISEDIKAEEVKED